MPQLIMRTSERRKLKRCEYAWEWGYHQRLKPLRDSNPLWFGQAIHLALADWYKPGKERGEHPAVTFAKSLDDGRIDRVDPKYENEIAEFTEHFEMGVDMLNRYVDTFEEDADWECIQPEMKLRVWIPHPTDKANKRWLLYVGTIDGVFRYIGESIGELVNGSIWLFEHKTAASIQVNHLPLDDQAGSYWALAGKVLKARGVLKPDEEISGIMYNFLRKATDDPRPKNADGYYCNKPTKQDYLEQLQAWATAKASAVPLSAKMTLAELTLTAEQLKVPVFGEPSKIQPAPYFERIPVFRSRAERRTMLNRMQAEGLRKETFESEHPLLPIVKNPTKDCSWDCEFFRMCQLHEAGEDWEEFRDATFKLWDPYGEHETRKSA